MNVQSCCSFFILFFKCVSLSLSLLSLSLSLSFFISSFFLCFTHTQAKRTEHLNRSQCCVFLPAVIRMRPQDVFYVRVSVCVCVCVCVCVRVLVSVLCWSVCWSVCVCQ